MTTSLTTSRQTAGGAALPRVFTVNIPNRDARAAYTWAAGAFLRWFEGQGVGSREDRDLRNV